MENIFKVLVHLFRQIIFLVTLLLSSRLVVKEISNVNMASVWYFNQHFVPFLKIYSTSLLVMLVLAVTDDRNMGASKGLVPISVGLIVTAIGMTFGYNCGYAINPARDFAPRLFSYVAGWPDDVWE